MKICFLLSWLILPLAFGGEWKDVAFREDANFQYWVGVSSEHETEKSALTEAYEEALNEAAKYNYGFKHQVVENTYVSQSEHKIHQESQWQSEKILFQGIKPLRQEVRKVKDKYQAYREVSYPKSEITKEKARLASLNQGSKEEAVEPSTKKYNSYGTVKINTNLPEAEVTLTKSDSPETLKLKIPGEITLATGVYYLRGAREGYSDVRQEIIVSGGLNFTNLNFKASLGTLTLKVYPSDAVVKLNGRPSSGKTLDLPQGAYRLEVSHPDYFSQSEEFEVLDSQGLYRDVKLKAKKGAVSIYSTPSQAEVFINGNKIGTTPLVGYQLLSEESNLEVVVIKEGYQLKSKSVRFKPNQSLEPLEFNLSKN